jgi:hypothetical protein
MPQKGGGCAILQRFKDVRFVNLAGGLSFLLMPRHQSGSYAIKLLLVHLDRKA